VIASLKPSFTSFLDSDMKEKGENRPMKRDGRTLLFHALSQIFHGNKDERTHSQAELGAVHFVKTQFAAVFSSAKPEPHFVKQILS